MLGILSYLLLAILWIIAALGMNLASILANLWSPNLV